MPYNESVINSKILANRFREMTKDFTPPYKDVNVCLNYRKYEINNEILYFLTKIQKLIEEKKCDGRTFINDIIQLQTLTLELLLYLEITQIFTIKQYFQYHETNQNVVDRMGEEIFECLVESDNSKIKRNVMSYYTKALFCDLKSVNEGIIERVLNLIVNNITSNEMEEKCVDFSSLLDLLKESELDDNIIRKFCLLILCSLMKGKVEPLKLVFKRQEKLKDSVKDSKTYKILCDIVRFCDVNDFVEHLKSEVLNHIETINYSTVFELIIFVGVYFDVGWSLLKTLCSDVIKESFQNFNLKHLAFGFIIARQCCFEKSNIFPSYLQWFSSTFSSESRRPINTKQICNFFFNFLTDLVPYDPAYYSKVHINRVPWVPADCQSVLSGYIILVKTQLCDLNISSELGICENTTEKSAAVFDVENVLRHFEKTNEILSSVFQAAMFWKEYYEKKFLVELLSKFDGKKSTRHKLIMKLHSLGKIPNSLYKNYKILEKK